MSNEKKFVDGLIVKDAPVDFVVAKLSFKVDELKAFLDANNNNGWVNADILTSKAGKMYAALNEWKPDGDQQQQQRPQQQAPKQFHVGGDLEENSLPF